MRETVPTRSWKRLFLHLANVFAASLHNNQLNPLGAVMEIAAYV